MKRVLWYARSLFSASIFCAAAFVVVFVLQPTNWKPRAVLFLVAGLITASVFAVVSKRLKAARLIIENQILHIQPAVLGEQGSRKEIETKSCENVEMFVSGFGILLGSKIIKFNQEGIQLKAVQIGRDYLTIYYGTNIDIQSIRLLYALPDRTVLADVIDKFRYETGIVPVVTE